MSNSPITEKYRFFKNCSLIQLQIIEFKRNQYKRSINHQHDQKRKKKNTDESLLRCFCMLPNYGKL